MTLEDKILLFDTLGKQLSKDIKSNDLDELLFAAKARNQWFTIDNLKNSLLAICEKFLNKAAIDSFLSLHGGKENLHPKNIGIVSAGNIPLVALQDVIQVVLSGHNVHFKPSSQDEILIQYLYKKAKSINEEFEQHFKFVDKITDADAYIATGSGNTSRYFEYYFAKKPHIIRKNRNSIAVLNGHESSMDFRNLAGDIFEFFGLGCRNVSKLLVPKGYDFTAFFEGIELWNTILMHSKYCNNYEYMKSIYLVNRELHLDNGFLLLRESHDLASPIAVLHYAFYEDEEDLRSIIMDHEQNLQVLCSNIENLPYRVGFGQSQKPDLGDFADHLNTMEFLNAI